MSKKVFIASHETAWNKIRSDRELDTTEKAAFARRRDVPPQPPPDNKPGRKLRRRFEALLDELEPSQKIDASIEAFFRRNKHLGKRIEDDTPRSYGHVNRADRLRSMMKASRDGNGRPLGKGSTELDADTVEELLVELFAERTPGKKEVLLRRLEDAGVALSLHYLWSFPITPEFRVNHLHRLPCTLGLPVTPGERDYLFVSFKQEAECHPACPTAFDAGLAHLTGAWIPGGKTQAAPTCAEPTVVGISEAYQRPPKLSSVENIVSFSLCPLRVAS